MNDENDDLFLQEMAGVQKLNLAEKVTLKKEKDALNRRARQAAATSHAVKVDTNILQTSEVPKVAPHDVIGFKRPGIQDGVFRKLRLGKYDIEARLDLHRKTVEEARRDVNRFVQDCLEADLRSVIIMPGKGDRNIEKPGVLKSYLVYWLEQLEDVQAFHTTQPHHGGAGAFYVLLRKSERKKQQAREAFSKGRV